MPLSGSSAVGGEGAASTRCLCRCSMIRQPSSSLVHAHAPRLPCVFHGFAELLRGEGVEHIVFGQPRAARLQHAVADLVEMRRVMGIGVDHDLHAVLFGEAKMAVAEVEPVGVCIQLHCNLSLSCGFQYGVEIELIGIATEKEPSSRMPEK